jgi:nucleoside-diphosphate-sugar epimerase
MEVCSMMNQIIMQDMEDIFARKINWDALRNKTILLTGAYGMLASYITYFIAFLNSKDYNIKLIAAVRSKEKFFKHFPGLTEQANIEVVEYLMDREIQIDGDVDYIIHAASFASPQYYGVCPVDVFTPNIIGNYHLLKLAYEKKVKSYLMFSSSDIYGTVEKTSISEDDFGGMDTLDIHSCYSESKRMAETMCKSFFVQYDVPVKIARIWHTYAPTMDVENDPRVFSSFVKNIIHGQNIEMKSDGSGQRCFCYITDAVAGYFAILLHGQSGEAYNVCNSSQYVSMAELAETLVGLSDDNLKVVKKERTLDEHYVENNLLTNRVRIPSDEKLRGLGWEAKVDIKDGFGRVIEFLRD